MLAQGVEQADPGLDVQAVVGPVDGQRDLDGAWAAFRGSGHRFCRAGRPGYVRRARLVGHRTAPRSGSSAERDSLHMCIPLCPWMSGSPSAYVGAFSPIAANVTYLSLGG
ncbi:hypothetical protein GCM10009799_35120 [Nocardiopsis rhodophaea]|uniref:Uncharacterized protein n=1 Tax=Nocardiopsis rhodophaea TaxID=280238 RepID=A0ABN2TC52_9ACTN